MEEIIKKLKDLAESHLGTAENKEAIIERIKLLKSNNIAPPPIEYLNIIHKINGIRTAFACFYGCINKKNGVLLDIVEENMRYNLEDKSEIIVLGHNPIEYLVYNNKEKFYETRDIITNEHTSSFNNIQTAISYFFDLY